MKEKYKLNQKRKRLEPTETLCKFCNKGHSEEMNKNYFAPLYNVKDRTSLIVYSSVKFNKIHIGIPRCNECVLIHSNSFMKAIFISVLLIAMFILILYLLSSEIVLVIFFSILIFSATIVLGPKLISNILIRNKGILTEKEGAKKDPLVKQMINDGWSLTQPSA